MRRRHFITAAAAAAGAALAGRPARATGGLDDLTPSPSPSPAPAGQPGGRLRVLLGRGQASAIDADSFAFGARTYRGTVSFTPGGEVLDLVPLEEYLYSVVPMESPHTWPQEALRAQAIVARTFALSRSNPNRAYDVVASERDQAYGGLQGEFAESTAAVNATAGQVLRWNNAVATVSYMSCCGGHTEDPADAWTGGADLPYLRGVACTYCKDSPDFHWSREIALSNVTDAFASVAGTIGTLQSIEVSSSDASGRAKSIKFTGTAGSAEVTGSDFRRLLGPAVCRSLLIRSITVNPGDHAQAGGTITIEGSGRGHGVGLCQWGSRGLASEGRSARDILSFYFPGIQIQ